MRTEGKKDQTSSRLRLLSLMMIFGHDLFRAGGFTEAAVFAVNNSRALLNFKSSSIIELAGGKAKMIAQYGQLEANRHSRAAQLQCDLCEKLTFDDNPLTITRADIDKKGYPADVLAELLGEKGACLIFELQPPSASRQQHSRLFWLIEFDTEVPQYALSSGKLMADSISEALFYHKSCESPIRWHWRRYFSGKRAVWWGVGLLLFLALAIRVPESATAEFSLNAADKQSVYAWFDGPIARCNFQDGARVKKGDVVVEYDDSQLNYRLSAAENNVREVEAELELENRSAFTERERLGKVKLLETRLEAAKVAVEEMRWYMEHSKLKAPADGILALADGRAELLTGKAVRTGDRIFDLYGGEGMVADIQLNERDSSVLNSSPNIILFLHTAPEKAIATEVVDIAPYPALTEQRVYCYNIRTAIIGDVSTLRYGMRGVARVSGPRVSLGYYLFKSVVLYFRGL